ncbi:MAG: hypothetical protein KTR33_13815 [Gammaproteobacteria bacterium]|nr:hypothetical protein [Gammaproteobacteria bacterium]
MSALLIMGLVELACLLTGMVGCGHLACSNTTVGAAEFRRHRWILGLGAGCPAAAARSVLTLYPTRGYNKCNRLQTKIIEFKALKQGLDQPIEPAHPIGTPDEHTKSL